MSPRTRNTGMTWLLITALACTIPLACSDDSSSDDATDGGAAKFALPADPANYKPMPGYQAMRIPKDNPMTLAKAELGRQLFFDTRLSGDGTRACYTCHLNEKGLTDGIPKAIGAFAKPLSRNSPTLWNIGFHASYYWDGRAPSLEKQSLGAWKGGNMGGGDKVEEIAQTISGIAGYASQFQDVFGEAGSVINIQKALATYMRTIISRDTPWDKYKAGEGDISEAAKRGEELFLGKDGFGCAKCHIGKLFTDQQFHNVGISIATDIGYGKTTKKATDNGKFKTPTMRDVVDTAPYFHDGSVSDLREVLKLMVGGGVENPNLESRELLKKNDPPTDAQLDDLIEFLKTLDEPGTLLVPTLPK